MIAQTDSVISLEVKHLIHWPGLTDNRDILVCCVRFQLAAQVVDKQTWQQDLDRCLRDLACCICIKETKL